jgi:hypothetical protein
LHAERPERNGTPRKATSARCDACMDETLFETRAREFLAALRRSGAARLPHLAVWPAVGPMYEQAGDVSAGWSPGAVAAYG